ncbi:MAG: hypothetical protein J1E36_04545 [Eubacterium sp.]|nr:hypothetical protein [Eubacterium sp.]
MDKKDYLGKVTEKIFDVNAKNMVTTELEGHIDERIDFYKEIGYDDQDSEEKAAYAMGDTDTVAAQFGELHNDFYNPVFDIVFLVIWAGLLVGIYYLLQKYVFIDIGLSSLLLSASCLSFAFMFGYSALSLFRNRIVPIIFSLFGIGATGVFNYFVLKELDKKMHDSLSNLMNFIFKTEIPGSSNYPNEERVILVISLISAIAVITFLFSFIYNIKVKYLANKRFDNKIRHMLIGITSSFTLAPIVLCVLFSVKCYYDLNTIKNEYYAAYDYVIELSEKCDTKEEIIDFVEKSDYEFTEKTDAKDNLTGYIYNYNLVGIEIRFERIKSKEEMREEQQEKFEELWDYTEEFVKKYYGYSEVMQSERYKSIVNLYKDAFKESIDKNVEKEYNNQAFCKISLIPRTYYFDNSYDRPSTSFLEVKEDRENKLYLYETRSLNDAEKYDYYKDIIPTKLEITYDLSDVENCFYDFSYTIGEGQYKHTEVFSAVKPNERNRAIYESIDKVIEIINSDKDMSSSKISKLTGAALDLPEMTREEFEKQFSALGSYFGSYKEILLDAYDMTTKYVFDDWYFVLLGIPYKEIYAYDKYGNLIRNEYLRDTPVMINYDGEDGQKKVRINGGYFDKKGYFYSQPDYAPYYTADGKRFYYYCKTIEDKTHTVGNTKEYYLTDRNNLFYNADVCFIDKNGYLYFNSGNLKYDEEAKKFKLPNGNEYTKAFETSWDENGNPILQSDENETTNAIF